MPTKSNQHSALHSPEALLRLARESSGKTPEEVAALAGITTPCYRDLETCSDEVTMAISLGELKRVCDALAITTRSLFSDGSKHTESQLTPQELVEKLSKHLEHARTTIPEFEDKVGFQITASLERPEAVADWNIDCLRSVCAEVGVDWLAALP